MLRNSHTKAAALIAGTVLVAGGVSAASSFAAVVEPKQDAVVSVPDAYVPNISERDHLALEQAIARVSQGLAGTAIDSIEQSNAAETSTRLVVSVSNIDSKSVEAFWLASLAQGAVADLVNGGAETTSDVISSSLILGPGDDLKDAIDIGYGSIRSGQLFGSLSDQQLIERVKSVADRFDLVVKSVQVVHPLESALHVNFVLDASRNVTWTIDELRSAVEGATPTVEGSLIELSDTDGNVLLTTGTSYRTGLGGVWFAPGQDERFNAEHGHAARR